MSLKPQIQERPAQEVTLDLESRDLPSGLSVPHHTPPLSRYGLRRTTTLRNAGWCYVHLCTCWL